MTYVNSSIPWLWMLVILLGILKVTGNVIMSWWWVFAPIWLPLAAVSGFILGLGLIVGVGFLFIALFIWICEKLNI